MKKQSVAKVPKIKKKPVGKEQQKISSFFPKLTIKKTTSEQRAINSSESAPKPPQIRPELKIQCIEIISDHSDSDFEVTRTKQSGNRDLNVEQTKKNEIAPKLVDQQWKFVNNDGKPKGEHPEIQFREDTNDDISASTSELVIDLNIPPKNTLKSNPLIVVTPDKTYLKQDEVLFDITTPTTNRLESITPLNLILNNYSVNKINEKHKSPPHSTPLDNKKRKFIPDSPDIIPPTPPQDEISKGKNKLKKKSVVLSPPRKKIRHNNENLECFLRKSPKNNTSGLSPTKASPSKLKKSLFLLGTAGENVENDFLPLKPLENIKKNYLNFEIALTPPEDVIKGVENTIDACKPIEIGPVPFQPIDSLKITPESEKTSETNLDPLKLNTPSESQESDDFIDDFDITDDWEEQIENNCQLNLEKWQLCRIINITKDNNQSLCLKLQSIDKKNEVMCLVQGTWQYTQLKPGNIINIQAKPSENNPVPYMITNDHGFLIYEPDLLISPTSIVSAQFCKRKGILNEYFRRFDSENKIMLVGTLVHQLLQEVLKKNIRIQSMVVKTLEEILNTKEVISMSYSSKIPIEELRTDLMEFVSKIMWFIDNYVKSNKRTRTFTGKNKQNIDLWRGKINSIEDIEENIWCPQLGIKGKIDVTIKDESDLYVPLELKTGRASMSLEHRGQLIIYSMLMTELGFEISNGLLLYIKEEFISEVKASHREKRDLIMLRNEVAYYLKQLPTQSEQTKEFTPAELPEPINHHSACAKCPHNTICTLYLSRDTNFELSDNHPLKQLSLNVLEHLKPEHMDYFIDWTTLLMIEHDYQQTSVKEIKDIWRLEPYEREKRGKALCFLTISKPVEEINNSYLHTFKRTSDINIRNKLVEKHVKFDLLQSGLTPGNYIVISTDFRHAIASGFIKTITEFEITVSLERNLNDRFKNKIFHLDTYESQKIINFSMISMALLMEATERANRLRELIIDRIPSVIIGKLPKSVMVKGRQILKRLNKIQQRAVLNALSVQDYLLIKGMPGTGKTATIVALIQLLVELNKTVLITSHTHSAVDNVCLRLLDYGVDILRLGTENRVHPRLKHRTESVLTANCKTPDELKAVYNSARVVAVTCLAVAHPMFNYRSLDFCIVDESTQVLQCTVIKALLSTCSFVLIGDPDQLPPVVKNPEAARRGMNISLFERLDNPNSTITLTLQYRMNKIITKLANSVTYQGELLCADDSISSAILKLPNIEHFQSKYKDEEWILNTLDTKLENSVIAINTGPTWRKSEENEDLLTNIQVAPKTAKDDEERKCSNKMEAGIVLSIVEALKEAGISSSSIGIIAPYRAQVALLQKATKKLSNSDDTVEVNTVDQFQGRDKEVIIYSCTRSRDIAKPKLTSGFEILDDKRRLTVAITRAKHKLIIIGDFQTLKDYEIFDKLLQSLQASQQIALKENELGFCWKKVLNRISI